MGTIDLERETMTDESKLEETLETKLDKIAKRSRQDPKMEFSYLMMLFNKRNLMSCFHELDGKKAVGIDRRTKEDYGRDLESNVEGLIARMKTMSYRAQPVREVLIPKASGGSRPLGISCIEDKIIQMMFAKILGAIYEPLFRETSFGFRPGRNCHQALKAVGQYTYENHCKVVIDLDLENYFGSIEHTKLVALIRIKIKDERFVRYLVRMLKSGILSEGELLRTAEGTPQGSIVSPILANIFGHYAMDKWFEDSVRKHIRGNAGMFRYCDDCVICVNDREDANNILIAMEGRLKRFGLRMNAKKTRVVPFDKWKARKGMKQGVFTFLGFELYIGRSRKGGVLTKYKTEGKRFRRKLKEVNAWCRRSRSFSKLQNFWKVFCKKLQGHINYYAISHNGRVVERFVDRAVKIFFKWINRRSQRRCMSWEQFQKFLRVFPPPKVTIKFRMF